MVAYWRALAVGFAVVACSSDNENSLALGNADGTGNSAGEPPAVEPAPGEYGIRAQLLAPNSEMAVAELDGKIYVLGGYPSSRVVQSTVQVYDVAADSWSMGPALPVPTHHPVVVGVAGKLYSMGGQHEGDANGGRAFSLDPAEGVWTELMPMPTPRGGGAAAVIDDKIYVAGGRPPAGNAFEVYDVGEGTWTALVNLPLMFNDRNHLAATAIAGKVYVAGGRYNGGNVASPITDSLDVYDPATNTWSSLARLPTPVHGVTGAAFVDGLIYIPGGGTASGGNSGSVIHQVYGPEERCE